MKARTLRRPYARAAQVYACLWPIRGAHSFEPLSPVTRADAVGNNGMHCGHGGSSPPAIALILEAGD